MRNVLAFSLLVALATPVFAQQTAGEISGAHPGFSLAYTGHGASSGHAAMPSIVGRMNKGTREQFGTGLGQTPSTMHVIEILGENNSVLKAITLDDLRGMNRDGGVKVKSSIDVVPGRFIRDAYDVALPGGKNITLVVKALATGDPDNPNAPHPLLVTYAIEGGEGERLALRLMLPTEGVVEATANGFIVAAKKSPAAFSATLLPRPQQVEVVGNAVSVTSQPVALNGNGRQTPMLWMQINGVGGSSSSAVREQALASLRAAEGAVVGPNIVVVSATDKSKINLNDTVSMTLIYVNIGTQSASGVTLNNPVPEGMRYLMASAKGDGMDVAYERAMVADGSAGEIKAVRWTMNGELKPGEERVASFKTIVQ